MKTEPPPDTATPRERVLHGVRLALPFAAAGSLLAMSFGVIAVDAGLSPLAAIVMSAIVFAGSAQFTAIAIIAQGGGVGSAVGAAALMNSRFLSMGIALAPSLPGRATWRALQGQTVVDVSWVMAARGDGTFDRWVLFGSSAPQYVTWLGGTVVGAYAGDLIGDPSRLGLDALYPAFFAALLLAEVRKRRPRVSAALGAVIALVLIPIAPPGVPVLAAGLGAMIGLRPRERDGDEGEEAEA